MDAAGGGAAAGALTSDEALLPAALPGQRGSGAGVAAAQLRCGTKLPRIHPGLLTLPSTTLPFITRHTLHEMLFYVLGCK